MPVFTSLKESKRKTRNRQKWLYGYSVDANAMTYLEGSGALMDSEVPSDLLYAGIDFDAADNMDSTADVPGYNTSPLIASMSMNGSMGNTLNFNFSYLMKIMQSYASDNTDNITEPASPPIDYGTTRYYCQGTDEPDQFSWSVNTNVINSGCFTGEVGSLVAKVKVNSFNASLTQYFENGLPDSESEANTYNDATGTEQHADFCTGALFLPPNTDVGTGGDDSKPLLATFDFSVSESGTEYSTEHASGWEFVTAECDGIPEIPTDWIEFDVIETT